MKTIIKLVLAAAIMNAAARVAMAEASFYRLKDRTQELVTFGAQASPGQLQDQIVQVAQALNVPLDSTDVEVNRDGARTIASAFYTQPVEVFPNYVYPLDFQFSVEALTMAGLRSQSNPLRN
jgi:hypothetical protein